MFEIELKKMISNNIYLANGLTTYKEKPSIFPYYVPPEAIKPYILFYTTDYTIPLKTETKVLTIQYVTSEEMTREDIDKYIIEIINTFDNTKIINEELGDLRIYLSGKPCIDFIDGMDLQISVNFIVRGQLKYWGII